MSAEENKLEQEMSEAIEKAIAEPKPQPVDYDPMKPLTTVKTLRAKPTLMEQFDIYDRCGVELRRRVAEERSAMIAAYERQVAGYQEEVRQHMSSMKADLDRRLREHDLLSQRL